eukprot:scpid36197/ scgid22720/ 
MHRHTSMYRGGQKKERRLKTKDRSGEGRGEPRRPRRHGIAYDVYFEVHTLAKDQRTMCCTVQGAEKRQKDAVLPSACRQRRASQPPTHLHQLRQGGRMM